MSTNPLKQPSEPVWSGRKRRVMFVATGVVLVVTALTALALFMLTGGDDDAKVAVFEVQRGPLTISVTESGTIQNRDLVIVKSEVEGRALILSLIPEGTTVAKGQLLVELDASQLVEQITQQNIIVMNTEANLIRSQQNLAITKSQAESNITQAKQDFAFAQSDLDKYEQGDFPQEVEQARVNITLAEAELIRAQKLLESSELLAQKQFITTTELEADQLTCKRRELDLQLAKAKLDLLEKYTYKRRMEELRGKVEQTRAALERVTLKSHSDVVQAEADLRARESEHFRQKGRLEKLEQQVNKCRITAPVAGMVVYSTTGKAAWRGNVEPLAEGVEVRERQELIYLPTTSSMMAQVKIHESSLRKIRKDLPVRVTVDAVPGKTFQGRVGKIALLPDAMSAWMNPDLKLYDTDIFLEGDAKELRAGMTCKSEIIVETHTDALYVPVQSVLRVQGKPTVYFPPKVPHQVEIGLDNNRMVHIVSGLAEGDKVLLAPPLEPSASPLFTEEEQGPPVVVPPPPDSLVPTVETQNGNTPPAGATGEQSPTRGPGRFSNMTPEERQKAIENLTPEQREALSRRRQGQGQRTPQTQNNTGE